MHHVTALASAIIGFTIATPAPSPRPGAAAALAKTVYVTVTDRKSEPLTDLTAADFSVKEEGKQCEIVKAAPASARMRLALLVEDRLMADSSVRVGVFEFLKRIAGHAEVALIGVGLRNTTVADYTTNLGTLVRAINGFTLNPSKDSNLAEAVLEIARGLSERRAERPVIVAVAISGGQAGVEPQAVLDKLRDSGATMYAVTFGDTASPATPLGELGDESGREQVLGDGPRQSGGRRLDVHSTGAVPKALQQVAGDLLAQYSITYALPDGVKPGTRVSISVKRKNVLLRAPSVVPAR